MISAKLLGVHRAQFGVVTTAPFGDIVEECRDIKYPWTIKFADDACAQGVFVRKFAHRESANVAQDLQNMLVNGVNVKKIMLHLTDDAPEIRQVGAEDVELVHASKFMNDATVALHQFQEVASIDRIGTECRARGSPA